MRNKFLLVLSGLLMTGFTASCDNKKNNNSSNASYDPCMNGGCGQNNGGGGGGGGQQGLAVTANLKGAAGLLVIDTAGGAALADQGFAIAGAPDDDGTDSSVENASLQKVSATGEVESAVSTEAQSSSGETIVPNDGSNTNSSGSNNNGSTNSNTSSPSNDGPAPVQTGAPEKQTNFGPAPKLPKILTIAVAPNGQIYLHFANPFMTAETVKKPECFQDAWNTPGCQCQLFRVKGGNYKTLTTDEPEKDNLECIDSTHYANSWQTQRNSVFQFDDASNVYYPASPAGNDGGGKMVVYRRAVDGSSTSEMINANICVNDFLVTKNGGMFYTGSSDCSGGGGASGGFFRYVSPNSGGQLREIARNWWNFVFEPVAATTSDLALFFGPDPRSSTTATWNTACLFRFDPAQSTAENAISNVITCGSDIWSWIDMRRPEDIKTYQKGYTDGNQNPSDAWKTEYRRRCESEGDIFAGGGSQISAVKQDSKGTVYVIGNLRKKNKGSIGCDLTIKGAHCLVDGIPYIKGVNDPDNKYSTKALCDLASGTWMDGLGDCRDANTDGFVSAATKDACLQPSNNNKWFYRAVNYNNVVSSACYSIPTANQTTQIHEWDVKVFASGTIDASAKTYNNFEGDAKVQTGWWRCNADAQANSSDTWTSEYNALAKVNPTTKSLEMLSGVDEQAGRLWLVNDVAYFSTYNTSKGKYYLKRWDSTNSKSVLLAEDFEAYHVSQSSADTQVYYDGLNFLDNTYSFGTMLTAAPYTRTQTKGLTGTVKTIVVLPK